MLDETTARTLRGVMNRTIPLSPHPVLRCPWCLAVLDGGPVIFRCPSGHGSIQGSCAVLGDGRTQ